ncbi:hypothetical protein GON01_14460 [Sphingomonas sp. MAH-20]|uniref:Lipoprotein n=1 Tax=Sphingomonas horti TaxID=2682842 RepID=A0A6I4J4V0_9SPHN|nr:MULTISPECIES: hypothetical protein [Sphingomonas]MBA2919101.1 hypothetical protein [Sphingomonas sp. CGMCC 1.13658]MVO79133.1 hypothetical protein [Sphingomonas horti]
MRSLALLLALPFVSGCQAQSAKAAVKDALVDPSSAQFDAVGSKGDVTCGLVNSKNRLGGYTGPRPFMVKAGVADIASDPLRALSDEYKQSCPTSSYDRILRVSLEQYNRDFKERNGL